MKASSKAVATEPLVGIPVPEVITSVAHDELNGWVSVVINVPPEIARRLKGRAQKQELGEYLNENIIRRALEGAVY